VAAILRKSGRNQFLRDFRRFQKKIAFYGALNGLAQVLVKIAAPGVPDFYQGTELWDLCLVDPDNRRPVDFKRRARLLEELRKKEAAAEGLAGLLRELLNHWEDGRVKLYLTWKALNFRRAHPALFLQGDYVPLFGRGGKRESVCAFARRRGEEWALMAVPRLATRLVGTGQFPLGRKVWGASALSLPAGAPTRWRNVLTGETLAATSRQRKKSLPLAQVFERFPVALLLGL
jgi:(1->4)-alpha-D-glucan 1-alpha-D-glucosylmutase